SRRATPWTARPTGRDRSVEVAADSSFACRRPVAAARRGSRGRAGGGRRTGTGGAGANGAGGRSSGGILSGSKPTDQLLGCGRSFGEGQEGCNAILLADCGPDRPRFRAGVGTLLAFSRLPG